MKHAIRLEETDAKRKESINGEHIERPVYRVLMFDDETNKLYYEFATFEGEE